MQQRLLISSWNLKDRIKHHTPYTCLLCVNSLFTLHPQNYLPCHSFFSYIYPLLPHLLSSYSVIISKETSFSSTPLSFSVHFCRKVRFKIMDNIAHFLFGIFGNVSALFLFLAPVITFKRIIKNKSTEKFSGIPYVMTLLNNLLSAWYGLPFVSPHNILVSTINGTGALIETIYVLSFIIFAPKKEKAKILGLFTLILTVFSAVVFISLFALHGNSRKLFCGFAAAIFSIIMYGSPLSIMRLVIKTKSVEFMPFFLSLFVFLCGTSWFIYGLLGRDPFVAVPNGVGSALGAMQLVLYMIYRDRKSSSKKATMIQEESMEMGAAKPPSQEKQLANNNGGQEGHVSS